jgi:hypothetical protein
MEDSDWNVSGKLRHSGTETHNDHLVPCTNILIYIQNTSYIKYLKKTDTKKAYYATRTLHTSRSTRTWRHSHYGYVPMGLTSRGSNPGRGDCPLLQKSVQTTSKRPSSLLFKGYHGHFPRVYSIRSGRPTTHLHLVRLHVVYLYLYRYYTVQLFRFG